jgi:hypothetical protein
LKRITTTWKAHRQNPAGGYWRLHAGAPLVLLYAGADSVAVVTDITINAEPGSAPQSGFADVPPKSALLQFSDQKIW